MAEQLIKCELLNGRGLAFSHCPKCDERLYEPGTENKNAYYWCPSCYAVFNSKRILSEDEIDRLFPDEAI